MEKRIKCKYYEQYGSCKFGDECKFYHNKHWKFDADEEAKDISSPNTLSPRTAEVGSSHKSNSRSRSPKSPSKDNFSSWMS